MKGLLEREAVLAPESETAEVRRLQALLAEVGPAHLIGPDGEQARLPSSVYTLLKRLVHELASGNAVAVSVVDADLTTQEAADLLNVSRPFLVGLLESGVIPFHRVGRHRRVPYRDLIAYRQRRGMERRAVLADMAREAQELGLYE